MPSNTFYLNFEFTFLNHSFYTFFYYHFLFNSLAQFLPSRRAVFIAPLLPVSVDNKHSVRIYK